jgi:eukaryotic-like serine/threonine-protein kinase
VGTATDPRQEFSSPANILTPFDDVVWKRWKEVDAIFAAALELPPERREPFIRDACGGDSELYHAVVPLVAEAEAASTAPTGPGMKLLQALTGAELGDDGSAGGLKPGDLVERYRITGELGRGGMATVFEAERADGVYKQQVALKVLRRGLDTEEVVRRFHDERDILSSLAHPNVASLLDGGTTADGRPFLVMQRVEGKPITRWADAEELDVSERLRLFLQVADAVAFAHRRLVVHRDIKPSNVLVDPQGRAILLDFGIARLLDPMEGPQGEPTRTGSRLLTPEYASPEQARGDAVTTVSDVYQLGVLLYLLLTGRRPFPPEHRGTASVAERREPMLPSEAVAQEMPERRRALKGDLDTILLKAMRPEAEERYGSAEALADDLRRHLQGHPITARPPSVGYRVRKFVRRNPWFPAAAAGLVLAIAGYVGTLEVQSRRLELERNVARMQAERAEEIKGFLVDLFRAADPYDAPDPSRSRQITVVEALELGAERARSGLADRPPLRADLLSSIARVYERMDLRDAALELFAEAMEIRAEIGEEHSLEQLADLGLTASILARAGQLDSAEVMERKRLALARAHPDGSHEAANALLGLASIDQSAARIEESLVHRTEAVRILRSQGPGGRNTLADALSTLSDSYRLLDRLDESEAAAREGLEIHREISGAEHPRTTLAEVHLAQLLHARGRLDDAASLYRVALPRLEASLGPLHFNTINSLNNLAIVLNDAGDLPGSEEIHRRVLDRRRRVPGGDTIAVATSLQNLAATVLQQGRLEEADSLALEAAELYGRLLDPGHPQRAFPLLTRTEIALRRGDGDGAEQLGRQASAILEGALPEGHFATATAHCRIGAALALQGRLAEAVPLIRDALAILEVRQRAPARLRIECREAMESLDVPESESMETAIRGQQGRP